MSFWVKVSSKFELFRLILGLVICSQPVNYLSNFSLENNILNKYLIHLETRRILLSLF